jgi:hypothetical protein
MQSDVKQVFYFHADANSIGGFLDEPFRYVPTPCSVSLSPAGGHAVSEAKHFEFGEEIKVRAAYTHVSGRPSRNNGPWMQRVVSVVEGVNILGRVTADRFVAQLFIEQPEASGGERKIAFAGSHISDLRIDGKTVKPVMSTTLLPHHHREIDAYDQERSFTPELKWSALQEFAYRQGVERQKLGDAPPWARERFGWTANLREAKAEDYTLCSLVDRIEGLPPGHSFGHFIDMPDFGRLFLAEAIIFPHAVHLTMFRAELGCKTTGHVGIATARSNGTTCPPN